MENIFFDKVTEPIPTWFLPRWIYNYKLGKYYDELMHTSPSYDMMREMAAFIKIAEISFFFHNTNDMKDGLPITYSKAGFIYIEFSLNQTSYCTIGLNQDKPIITISIKNTITNEIVSSNKFRDRELEITNKIDEYLFINLINKLMNSFINLMKYCKEI